MKNSWGWSPTWPSIRGGTAGGGKAGVPPRPSLPRTPRRPRPRPLPLPLVAGSAAARSWDGGTRCRAATLAATVEGPAPPLTMADGRKKPKWKKVDNERMWDAIPLPILIKRLDRGSAAPLNQSGHQRHRESRPTRCPNQRRPIFPPPPPATLRAWRTRGKRAESEGQVRRPFCTP
jgi:hypothetical protein